MRYALVQGVRDGMYQCEVHAGMQICIDDTIRQMHAETLHLDFVPAQGFRLYTDSEYLATHLRLLSDWAQV